MAEYPEGNPGAFPLDPNSDVGKLRLILGDTQSEPYDPVEPGFQNYKLFSDAELQGFIDASNGSLLRAAGFAYMQLAAQASMSGVSIRDADLAVDTKQRASDLIGIANFYFGKADDEDAADAFFVGPIGQRGDFIPEATVPIWGRRYTWDVWR